MNHDQEARDAWGPTAYDAIPKSVFALVAWHLADIGSEQGIGNGGAVARFREEVRALTLNGLIDPAQSKRVLAALPE